MNNWLKMVILDNSIVSYLWFLGIVLIAFIFKKYISKLINYVIYKIFGHYIAKNRLKEFQTMVLRPMQWFIVIAILVIALEAIKYPVIWKVELFNQPLQNLIGDLVHGIFLYSFILLCILQNYLQFQLISLNTIYNSVALFYLQLDSKTS